MDGIHLVDEAVLCLQSRPSTGDLMGPGGTRRDHAGDRISTKTLPAAEAHCLCLCLCPGRVHRDLGRAAETASRAPKGLAIEGVQS